MKSPMRLLAIFASFLFTLSVAAQQRSIDYFRPYDKEGVNMFETPKDITTTEFEGVRVRIGGNFAQQFQGLDHSNNLVDTDMDGEFDNRLYALRSGFNLATANLNIDAQLAPGVRLNLITYLSSRHHPEAWVKGGFIQFDELPFLNSPTFDRLMENLTIRIGHMEINYGDQHFRRTDNGNALYNPFIGNYIVDAFNTEIGGEIYYQNGMTIAMLGITGGEINGNIGEPRTSEFDDSDTRAPSIIAKLGVDSKDEYSNFRYRLTGSVYTTNSSATNHLYTGDRGGSRYYLVMSPPDARAGSDFRTGRYSPGFTDKVTAGMFNAFLQAGGLEFFGTYELASGRSANERDKRNMNQFAAELLYRFGTTDDFYFGGRYNTVNADDPSGQEISINRYQLGAGWFVTDNLLIKGEYVNQQYNDFPTGSLLDGGEFNGFMLEAVVGF